ncbi:MAG: hypothetical protein ACP5HU_04445 [Phycisphaerae bacterium]
MSIGEFIRRRKLLLGVAGGAIAVGCGAILLWAGLSGPPDPEKQSPEEVVEYLASEDFGKLSTERKREYLEQAREAGRLQGRRMMSGQDLSDEQRQQYFENMADVGRQHMRERLDEFFALPQEQRTEFIDRMLDRFQNRPMRPADERSPAASAEGDDSSDGAGDGRRSRGGFTAEHMKRMIENTDPEDRARMAEFVKAMQKRMEERGISPPWRRR